MNHLSPFVIHLGILLSVLTGSFFMVRGLVNALFNKDYAQAYGPGDALNSSALGCSGTDYAGWSGDCGASFGRDCGGGSAGGHCG